MKTISNYEFTEGLKHNRQQISDYVLEGCTFESWSGLMPVWSNADPALRPTIRNVTAKNSNAFSVYLQGAIIEDVVVDTTKAGKAPIFLRGNAYKHVTLKGKIGRLEIRGKVFPPWDLPAEVQKRIITEWDKANAEYYQNVDWALDITQATYGSFSISGIPARLVRRNSENTAVVTRKQAVARPWDDLPFKDELFRVVLDSFVEDGYDDVVLIACPKSKNYAKNLDDLALLRSAGIAQ